MTMLRPSTAAAAAAAGRRLARAALSRAPRWRSAAPAAVVPSAGVGDRFFSTTTTGGGGNNKLRQIKTGYRKEIESLPEHRARSELSAFLAASAGAGSAVDLSAGAAPTTTAPSPFRHRAPTPPAGGYSRVMTPDQIRVTLDAAMATFHLHVESRIAALCGQGFYTIGPCGEEMLAGAGCALHPYNDAVALHYRHLGVSLARQLRQGRDISELMLDRARGYTVSRSDPVTGGVHCAIGSARGDGGGAGGEGEGAGVVVGGGDYVVTSTLASQCPPAVGRALGFSLAEKFLHNGDGGGSRSKKRRVKVADRPISFVTLGDGSLHNGHFLSAYNLARHARYRRIKCPVVFGISDNGLSISYSTDGYAQALFNPDEGGGDGGGGPGVGSADNADSTSLPVYRANGCDMLDVYDKTVAAFDHARRQSSPALVLYREITRRFGHAATDRQHAYLSEEDVNSMMESDVVSGAVVQAVEVMGAGSYGEWRDRFEELGRMASDAFEIAAEEEKITDRKVMMEQVSRPLAPVPRLPADKARGIVDADPDVTKAAKKAAGGKAEVMRKHMTRVVAETLADNPDVVYIGEDVEHGGYYLVTDGLAELYPGRVVDFPPDETTLLGAAMGYSQVGLTPIVEIPYAKYLDCGADMFYELAISNWLTNGQIPNGMIVRVQGFDRGVFGGNFHTHNMINHMPPGVDVVCYSNGRDYARGFRNAVLQAKAGRVVMLVDCTHLLNLRHLHGRDRGWETPYPEKKKGFGKGDDEIMGFDDVVRYGTNGKRAIVTYGNGVVTALQARKALADSGAIASESDLDVIDCPLLSSVPAGLREALADYAAPGSGVLFADICKEGPGSNPLSAAVTELRRMGDLPDEWDFVAAPRTYNPLGNTVTFLNVEDVVEAYGRLAGRSAGAGGGSGEDEDGQGGEDRPEERVAQ